MFAITRLQGLIVQIQPFEVLIDFLIICQGFLLSKTIHCLHVSEVVGQDFHGLLELEELADQILFGRSLVAGEDVFKALGVVSHY